MLKVIIADDEKKICQLLQTLVDWEALNLEVVAVKYDGIELLDAVRELKPEIVITDIRMPGVSGLELLHNIRKEKLDIDVLIMSGYREFEYVQSALRDGASDYLLKPLGKTAVMEALEKICQRREAVTESRHHVEKIQRNLKDASLRLRQSLIEDVANGKLKIATREILKSNYHCEFDEGELYFATVKIDLAGSSQKVIEIMIQKFQELAEKILKEHELQFACGRNENYVYLLVDCNEFETMERSLYHLIYDSKDYMSKLDNAHVTVGLAQVEEGRLGEAFSKSKEAVFDQVFRGYDRVLVYQKNEQEEVVFMDESKEGELRKALYAASSNKFVMVLQGYLQEIHSMGQKCQSGHRVYMWILELQNAIIRNCHSLYQDSKVDEYTQQCSVQLGHCYDWNSYVRLFQKQQIELLKLIKEVLDSREKKPIRQMKRIIEERYMESLTLELLAEEMELSPAYVSRLFKKEIGVNFTKYLNSVRLEAAKRLLETTNQSSANIAWEVGYNDDKYFLKLFKKEIGLTTNEYKRLYGE